MPLDEHIEGGHGERGPRLKIGPHTVHHLFKRTIRLKARITFPCKSCLCYGGLLALHIDLLEKQDGTTMAYRWPAGTAFKRIDMDVADRACPVCACSMHVCDHRSHHLWTLEGADAGGQPPGALSGALVRASGAHLQPRSRMVHQHAALVSGLGGVVLARPSPLCPPLVGIPASGSMTGPAPDPVVRRCYHALYWPVPNNAGSPAARPCTAR